jgi:hypothetical protein
MLAMCYFVSRLHVLFEIHICVISNTTGSLSYFVVTEYVL